MTLARVRICIIVQGLIWLAMKGYSQVPLMRPCWRRGWSQKQLSHGVHHGTLINNCLVVQRQLPDSCQETLLTWSMLKSQEQLVRYSSSLLLVLLHYFFASSFLRRHSFTDVDIGIALSVSRVPYSCESMIALQAMLHLKHYKVQNLNENGNWEMKPISGWDKSKDRTMHFARAYRGRNEPNRNRQVHLLRFT